MLVQLELLGIMLLVLFLLGKQGKLPGFLQNIFIWIRNFGWPWVCKNLDLLLNLVPAACGIFLFIKMCSHMGIPSTDFSNKIVAITFMDIFGRYVAAIALGAIGFGVSMFGICLTRGLMTKWRGW